MEFKGISFINLFSLTYPRNNIVLYVCTNKLHRNSLPQKSRLFTLFNSPTVDSAEIIIVEDTVTLKTLPRVLFYFTLQYVNIFHTGDKLLSVVLHVDTR